MFYNSFDDDSKLQKTEDSKVNCKIENIINN